MGLSLEDPPHDPLQAVLALSCVPREEMEKDKATADRRPCALEKKKPKAAEKADSGSGQQPEETEVEKKKKKRKVVSF